MNHNIEYLTWTFTPDKISSGNLYLAASLLASSLEVNSLTAEVECDDPGILDFERNTPLRYYTRPDQPMIFRVQTIKRVGPKLYELTATSTLGLLSEGQHMGGIYTGQTAREVIASICGTVPFAVKHNLEEIKLYGWLPIASPRDNLAQVLFAIGAALKTDLDGVLRIEGLWDGIAGTVTRDDMYTEAAVDYDGKVTQVIVSEHQYVPWTEVKQLFEGTTQEGDIITFDEPMHTLTADGFTILASGANWAKVSAGSGVLSGKTYLHNTRQITKDVWPAQEPNVKTVKDATLVSLVNSQACAQRLADYYKCRERVNAPAVYHGELPGDRLATYHPFDKTGVAACLESADINLSNTLKAQGTSLVGFVPKQVEQTVTYDHHEVLTGSGEWEVPEGTTHVLAVIIQAGQAGFDGENGHEGAGIGWADGFKRAIDRKNVPAKSKTNFSASVTSSTSGTISSGTGGKGGLAGTPGKIYQVEREVVAGNMIPYNCGVGGTSNGEMGGETTFGEDSSASGAISPAGYTDVISGTTYAKPGISGSDGANGGSPGSDGGASGDVPGGKGYSETSTQRSGRINGGTHSAFLIWQSQTAISDFTIPGVGGGGAGGSSGDNQGHPGRNGGGNSPNFSAGINNGVPTVTGSIASCWGGSGGDGADGDDGITYGSPGNGGGAGGGPGGCGKTTIKTQLSISVSNDNDVPYNPSVYAIAWTTGDNKGGSVGVGGKGGAGAPGCIILYYGVEKKIQTGQLVDKNNKMILDRLGRRIIV